MQPPDLRVALFSGNYNYIRDGANQALNLLVGHLMARGATVRVYSPTTDTPAFTPTGIFYVLALLFDVGYWLMIGAVILTLVSGYHYLRKAAPLFRS